MRITKVELCNNLIKFISDIRFKLNLIKNDIEYMTPDESVRQWRYQEVITLINELLKDLGD